MIHHNARLTAVNQEMQACVSELRGLYATTTMLGLEWGDKDLIRRIKQTWEPCAGNWLDRIKYTCETIFNKTADECYQEVAGKKCIILKERPQIVGLRSNDCACRIFVGRLQFTWTEPDKPSADLIEPFISIFHLGYLLCAFFINPDDQGIKKLFMRGLHATTKSTIRRKIVAAEKDYRARRYEERTAIKIANTIDTEFDRVETLNATSTKYDAEFTRIKAEKHRADTNIREIKQIIDQNHKILRVMINIEYALDETSKKY